MVERRPSLPPERPDPNAGYEAGWDSTSWYGDEDVLPVWAKEYIRRRRADLEEEIELIEDFETVRLNFLHTLKKFPEGRRKEIIFGEWALVDVVAHMSGWMIAATENTRCLKQGKTPPWVESINEFNKTNAEERKGLSWRKIYDELAKSSQKFVEEYRSLAEELWDEQYWPERSFTPRQILEIELEHWRDKHLPSIAGVIEQEI